MIGFIRKVGKDSPSSLSYDVRKASIVAEIWYLSHCSWMAPGVERSQSQYTSLDGHLVSSSSSWRLLEIGFPVAKEAARANTTAEVVFIVESLWSRNR